MSRIQKKFKQLEINNEKAMITYVTCGDPSLEKTHHLVLEMEKAGASIVELGIPYSDPIADGPVIQRAAHRALSKGLKVDDIFKSVSKIRADTQIPLVFLVYFNTVYKYGVEKFLENCHASGVDGLVIPDLPLEERLELKLMMQVYSIDLIPLVAPTSSKRIPAIVKNASGFIYCISATGVTGVRNSFDQRLSELVEEIRVYSDIPVAIGFGVSNKSAVAKLKDLCDGVIIGSAIVKKIEAGMENDTIEKDVYDFVKELKEGLA